jgi:hypothetical protein
MVVTQDTGTHTFRPVLDHTSILKKGAYIFWFIEWVPNETDATCAPGVLYTSVDDGSHVSLCSLYIDQ